MQCVLLRFHSFLFSRNERREVYGVGIFAGNDGDDVRRQTSACGGMVAKHSVIYCVKVQPFFQAMILCVMKAACLLKTSVLKRLFRRSRSLEKR